MDLAEIKRLRAALDKGTVDTPWYVSIRYNGSYKVYSKYDVVASEQYTEGTDGLEPEQSNFIARSPEMIDYLIKALDEAHEMLDQAHKDRMKGD